jgi:hypothetical protein
VAAWRSFKNHTFAAHARVFPSVWYNIWSGPDGLFGKTGSTPGCSWASLVTPMSDFPVMNANQDAMALLALIRVCGVRPSANGDGLIIAPQAPPERFCLDTQLLRLEVTPGRIAGTYRAVADGSRTLHIHLPESAGQFTVKAEPDEYCEISPDTHRVDLKLTFKAGQVITFEVNW